MSLTSPVLAGEFFTTSAVLSSKCSKWESPIACVKSGADSALSFRVPFPDPYQDSDPTSDCFVC